MIFKNYDKIIQNGKTPELKQIRKDILSIISYATESMNPYFLVKSIIKSDKIIVNDKEFAINNYKNIFLIGFGKASIGMTNAICDTIEVESGIIITNDPGEKILNNKIQTYHGSHPIPNQNCIDGTNKIINLIKNSKNDDLIIILISGGGSSLLCKPKIDLKNLQKITDLLLKSGADINEINIIRKHLSFVKGGQLIKNVKGTVISLIISDVINDPIESIASGPTYPDKSTYRDSKDILIKYNIWNDLPNEIKKIIQKGIKNEIPETLKKDNPIFNKVHNLIIGNNIKLCSLAEKKGKELGYKTSIITTTLKGESSKIGKSLINIKNKKFKNQMLISSGETTVRITGDGNGGRNQELVLGIVNEISGKNIVFSSFATDGIDGISDAAGAIADGFTFNRSKKKDLDIKKILRDNNSYEFFESLDDLLITGPTGTNIMDIQIIYM